MMIKLWRRRWFRSKRSVRRSLKGTHVYSLLGHRAFHPKLWKSDKRSIAGGLAVGLFTAFTPTIPFQMLIAAIGSIFFKVNMPLALLACWVTNPLTAVPIYVASRRLGKAMLTFSSGMEHYVGLFIPSGHMGRLIREGLYLASGSLVFAGLAALTGYLVVQGLWWMIERREVLARRLRKQASSRDIIP